MSIQNQANSPGEKPESLSLPEEMLLLALEDTTGQEIPLGRGVTLESLLVAAALLELWLSGHIRHVSKGESRTAVQEAMPSDTSPTARKFVDWVLSHAPDALWAAAPAGTLPPPGDAFLAAILRGVTSRDRVLRESGTVLSRLYFDAVESVRHVTGKSVTDCVADVLIERGILQRSEERYLLLFRRTRLPQREGSTAEATLRADLTALLTGAAPLPPGKAFRRLRCRVALLERSGLLAQLLPGANPEAVRRAADMIVGPDPDGSSIERNQLASLVVRPKDTSS